MPGQEKLSITRPGPAPRARAHGRGVSAATRGVTLVTADGLAQHSMRMHLGLVLLLSLAQQQQRARAQDAAADRTIR